MVSKIVNSGRVSFMSVWELSKGNSFLGTSVDHFGKWQVSTDGEENKHVLGRKSLIEVFVKFYLIKCLLLILEGKHNLVKSACNKELVEDIFKTLCNSP